MAERPDADKDRLVDELLDRLGHAWPQTDAQLDSWLHERSVPPEDQAWIKDVVRRRIDEARGVEVVGTPVPTAPVAAAKPAIKRRRLSFDDLASLNRELLELVRSRVPLPVGLAACAEDLGSGKLAGVLDGLRADLDAGLPLSEAMARQGEALPPVYHALVGAGEATGDLVSSLIVLSEQAEVDAEIERRTRDALVYPGVVVFASVLGLAGAFALTAPPFHSIFESMNVELPALTRLTLGIGSFLRDTIWVGAPLAVATAAALAYGFVGGGRWLARGVLYRRTPDRALAEMARSLAGFLEKGVPATGAFRALCGAYGPRLPSRALEGVLTRLEDGSSLGAALRADPAFPRTFVWLVAAAEERGTLPGTLLDLAGQYERRFKRRLKFIETFAPPIALIAVSFVVALGVLSVFLPIFKLQQVLAY